ncbi:type VI secretion system Vgr family protein [Myroides sp. WP-1]|uniref:type VI secretion system Vgr family protein n=1 Tax=Myroides sp. WP-1 TaxID=2759944 RepID=UPI002106D8B8|nr:phage baseplate assembly protein V [Myroides sp. WP-1]
MEDMFSNYIDSTPEGSIFSTKRIYSNAIAIAKHYIPGVNQLVDVKFIAEGKELVNYKSFELVQSTQAHHSFVVSFSCDCLGTKETYRMDEAQKLLGKHLLVSIRYKNLVDKPERFFSGIITQVSFEQGDGSEGYLILKGNSPTILLDQAPHLQSFGGNAPDSLSYIVNKILDQGYYKNQLFQSRIKLSKDINIAYSCQYNETAYNYLTRLAAMYDEQFFYDGEILHFGELPKGEKPISLVYGRDVSQVEIQLQARHVSRQFYGYNSFIHKYLHAESATDLRVKGTLAKSSYMRSKEIFKTPSLQQVPLKASTDQDVLQAQRHVIGNEGIQVFVITGVTTIPFLYPGCVVELNMLQPNKKVSSHFTTLIITDIEHTVDALGQYSGKFKAVDAQTGYIPQPVFTAPIAEPQIGIVVNNEDPKGKGRVQVQFSWQDSSQQTDFIRVMSGDAGSSDQVKTNRGMVFIPEKGDQVMVSFVSNHPDCPFVMGSFFHGGNAAGGGVNNQIKSIQTRSGHTLKFTEEESIEIYDVSGNYILLDTTEKSINLTAPESILLTARNIQLRASENVTIQASENIDLGAQRNLTVTAGENYYLTANNQYATVVATTKIESKTYFVISEVGRIETTQESLQLASTKEVENLSGKRVKIF